MMSWNKAPNDRGAALILTLGWSAVLLALSGVVSSAVLQQVRPSDNAESSYQAWAAAEAGARPGRGPTDYNFSIRVGIGFGSFGIDFDKVRADLGLCDCQN